MITATVVPSERLTLVPVSASHAGALFNILSDHTLYAFTGSKPPWTLDEVTYWFSPAGGPAIPQLWLTWIVHLKDHTPISYVQAMITEAQGAVSWLNGTAWQGQGYASEATTVLVSWLVGHHINGGSCLWVELGCYSSGA